MAPTPTGRAGVFHTLRLMRGLVERYKTDPRIIQTAATLLFTTPERIERAEVSALFEFVRDHIRYVRDVHGVETLANPVLTLARQIGDCDDQATLLATLCEAVGYPSRFVAAAYHSEDFEHVFVQIFADGNWIDADPTERGSLGYSPPDPLLLFIEGA